MSDTVSTLWISFDDETPPDKEPVFAVWKETGGVAIVKRSGNRIYLYGMCVKQSRLKCWMHIPPIPK